MTIRVARKLTEQDIWLLSSLECRFQSTSWKLYCEKRHSAGRHQSDLAILGCFRFNLRAYWSWSEARHVKKQLFIIAKHLLLGQLQQRVESRGANVTCTSHQCAQDNEFYKAFGSTLLRTSSARPHRALQPRVVFVFLTSAPQPHIDFFTFTLSTGVSAQENSLFWR